MSAPEDTEVPGPVKTSDRGRMRKWFIPIVAVATVATVLAATLLVYYSPDYSWDASIRDHDGDGYSDNSDAFPYDSTEWGDLDVDGYGDNCDCFPSNPDEWEDSDQDGVGDNGDDFPYEPTQWLDTDGDGYGNNQTGIGPDLFPEDPSEWNDTDSDGYGDNEDVFPDDPAEWNDTDDDGVGDNSDAFPLDPTQWSDQDGDGYGDNPLGTNPDEFPNDPSEWMDTDGDGVGDNSDAFPTNPTQWADRDGDGYGDNPLGLNPDEFPDDPTEWRDTDSDCTGDNADFYDSGNGKIKISITLYQGDGSADFWTSGDPYFIIRVDTNDDGTYEVTAESNVFVDTERIVNPYSLTVDIDDGTPVLRFVIYVYDDDIDTSDVIDYTPTTAGTAYSHLVLSPFTGSWSYDGDDDGLSEIDCELEYSISVTT